MSAKQVGWSLAVIACLIAMGWIAIYWAKFAIENTIEIIERLT